MIKVLVSGYLGFDNSGDESILKAITTSIKKDRSDIELTVFSSSPKRTADNHGIKSIYSFNPFLILRELARCDILISGGGNLLQDKTSSHSLWYYILIIMIAKIFRKKVMLYANGVGPLNRRFNRWLVKKIINRVNIITIREALSIEILKEIGVTKPKVELTADPVYMLSPCDEHRLDEIMVREGVPATGLTIGVSVRKSKTELEQEKIALLCNKMIEEYQANIVLIPMQYPADFVVCEQLAKQMQHPVTIIEEKYSSEEQIGIVGRMDIVISMRLHTLIYSSLMGRPMMGIIYDEKIMYFLQRINMPYVKDIENTDITSILKKLDDLVFKRDEYSIELKKNSESLREEAFRNNLYLYNLIDGRGRNDE